MIVVLDPASSSPEKYFGHLRLFLLVANYMIKSFFPRFFFCLFVCPPPQQTDVDGV